ncbi:MAG: hypothetical protein AB2A00_33055 [Myxococcota bacterium]
MARQKKPDEPILLTRRKDKQGDPTEDLSAAFNRALVEAAEDPDGIDEDRPVDVSRVLQAVVDEHEEEVRREAAAKRKKKR